MKALAAQLGLTGHGYLSELETGKKVPSADLVIAIAALFAVSIDSLFSNPLPTPARNTGLIEDERRPGGVAFVDRSPDAAELERFRLVLSTFQDGSGMNAGGRQPGWRDFERSIAEVFGGTSQENKAVFDVLLPLGETGQVAGLSCKMGEQLDRMKRTGHAFMELSNSAKKFWDFLAQREITAANYRARPQQTGQALLELVATWHNAVSLERGGTVDLDKSTYLVLAYNRAGEHQLAQFPLLFPPADALRWEFPARVRGGQPATGNLRAVDETDALIFEWYGESGGQLKYYPPLTTARWVSPIFALEPIPPYQQYGILAKAAQYFPDLWQQTLTESDDSRHA